MILTNYIIKERKTTIFGELIKNEGVREMTIEATPKEIADLVDLLLSRQNEKNDLKIDSNSIYQAAKNCYRSNSLMKENNF